MFGRLLIFLVISTQFILLTELTSSWMQSNSYEARLAAWCKTPDNEIFFSMSCRYRDVLPKCIELDGLAKAITQNSNTHNLFNHYIVVTVVCEDSYYQHANYAPRSPEFHELYENITGKSYN